jgi:hypothetical protein
MTLIKKLALCFLAFWFGGVVTALSIFWVVDLPQTVRLKAAIVRILPLDPESRDSTIRNLCAGSHSGSAMTDCYLAFSSEEAANAISDDLALNVKCQQLAQRMESGEEKDWRRAEPMSRERLRELVAGEPDPNLERKLFDDAPRYLYVGNDPSITEKGIIWFLPKECEFRSPTERYLVTPY